MAATFEHFGITVGSIVYATDDGVSGAVIGAAPSGIPQFMKDEADKVDDRGDFFHLDEFENMVDITKYTKNNKKLTEEELEILNTEDSKAVDPGVIYVRFDDDKPATQEELDFLRDFDYSDPSFGLIESEKVKDDEYTGPKIVFDQTYQESIAEFLRKASDGVNNDETDDENDDDENDDDEDENDDENDD